MQNANRTVGVFVVVAIGIFASIEFDLFGFGRNQPVTPDWPAIAAWPNSQAESIEAQPDPNRAYTAIVLDDSGSMGTDITPAKAAVIAAIESMGTDDQVSVIALNDGLILPFMPVGEALTELPEPLSRVYSNGSTPLTTALRTARDGLADEASRVGGFGTYRILVTTDGAADDGDLLRAEIEDIARQTPIQIATIGVGITGRHVLSRPDLAAFVSVDDISGLAGALRTAIAEEQTFSAITEFESQ